MGHFIFAVFHVLALLFGALWLVFTVPLHLIYAAVRRNASDVSDRTHTRCPQCREPVRRDAVKCKHCGGELVPVGIKARAPIWRALDVVFVIVIIAVVLDWIRKAA